MVDNPLRRHVIRCRRTRRGGNAGCPATVQVLGLQGVFKTIMHDPGVPEDHPPEASPGPTDRPPPGGPPKEHGGRKGPEPTRYGDWEKNGRCIDF
jgi:hypothetical protein